MDENDNLPVFTQEFYQVALKENTAKRENSSYAVTQAVKLWWVHHSSEKE